MDILFLFLCSLIAVCGLYLLVMNGYWFYRSDSAQGEVLGFQGRKYLGRFMPVVRYVDRDEIAVKAPVKDTDHLGFMLSRAQEGEVIPVRYDKNNAKLVRISGLGSFILGVILQVPLIFILISMYGDDIAKTQFSFLAVILLVIGGGWVLLRLIREVY